MNVAVATCPWSSVTCLHSLAICDVSYNYFYDVQGFQVLKNQSLSFDY